MFLFWSLSRRVLHAGPALLALAMFSFSRWLIFYSSDVKQYSTDVLACTWLLLAAVVCLENPPGRRRAIGLALGGVAAGLLSHPALFVAVGVAVVALAAFLQRRERSLAVIAMLSAAAAIGAGISVAWSSVSSDPEARLLLPRYWERFGGMPPAAQGGAGVPGWFARALRKAGEFLGDASFLSDRVDRALGIVLVLGAIGGAVWLWRAKPVPAAFLVLPVLVTAAGAVAHRYPFSGRLILFLFPSFLISIAAAFEWTWPSRAAWVRAASTVGAAGLASIFAIRSVTLVPEHFEELRPVLQQVRDRSNEVPTEYWVYSSADKAFRYYSATLALPRAPSRYVCRAPELWPHYVSEVERLDPGSRVWVILSHLRDEEAAFIRASFDVFGTREAQVQAVGAAAYLYTMKPPDPEAVAALRESIPQSKRAGALECLEERKLRYLPPNTGPVGSLRP